MSGSGGVGVQISFFLFLIRKYTTNFMNVDVYNLIKKGEFVIQGNGSFFSGTKSLSQRIDGTHIFTRGVDLDF